MKKRVKRCFWMASEPFGVRFSQLCDALRIDQPSWSEFATLEVRLWRDERAREPRNGGEIDE